MITIIYMMLSALLDPRTKHWFMMSSPGPITILAISYLYFCKSLGPSIMKNRSPFELKKIVMLYNISQVLMSLFLLLQGLQVLLDNFNFSCEPCDYTISPRGIKMAAITWWYFFAKITELLDTIFFVLRKKLNQVSFLHVYHHTLMLCGMWVAVKFFPGGHQFVMGTLNSFVHVVMYTYYFISGLGPEYQKYIWWKKYVTDLQLIQFVIVFCHNLYPLFTDCGYPKILNALLTLNACVFIYLFGKFYFENYDVTNVKNIKNGELKSNGTSNGKNNGSIYMASYETSKWKAKQQ